MNKHILKRVLLLAAVAVMGAGCDVEDYNEAYLDGFEPNGGISQVEKIEYTLTDDDYKSVATNKTNLALATTDEELAALKAVEKNKCFSAEAPASRYLPAFFATKYGYYLSNGSSIMATYRLNAGLDESVSQLASAATYTLTAADYATVWGEVEAAYFTPSKSAELYLPVLLKKSIVDPEVGDYVIAEYAYSAQEPSTGEGEAEEKPTKIADIAVAGDYMVEGTVSATYARGFVVADDSGAILVYSNSVPNYSLGDVVRVKGAASQYNGGWQLGGTLEMALQSRTKDFKFPTATVMSGTDLDAYLTNVSVKFASMTGTLSISGNYYNMTIDGAATAVGSLSFPHTGQVDASLNGKRVTATGYLFQASKSGGAPKYANMILTSIVEEGQAATTTPVGIVAAAAPGTYTVKGQVAAMYKRGFLVNDGTGSILFYKNAEVTDLAVGDLVQVEGTTSAYAGLNQYPKESTYTKLNESALTFKNPTPRPMTGADMDAYISLPTPQYVTYTGKLVKSGNYYNVEVEGALASQGSLQYVLDGAIADELVDQQIVVEGWAIGVASGKFVNTMITSVTAASATTSAVTRAAVTTTRYAVYTYNGSAWVAPEHTTVVNPEDYAQMGASKPNFSSTLSPDVYLPKFLAGKYPYALADDVMNVAYNWYNGSATSVAADRYTFDGATWTKDAGIVDATDQFVLSGNVWNYDPSITIVLPPIKTDPSYSFYMLCIDWIKANIENGENYVDAKYQNDEVYAGTSAYYGNIDWRPSNALGQYAEPYEGMSDDEIVEALKEHTKILFAGVIPLYVPGLKPISGIDVTVTLQVAVYTGTSVSAPTHSFVYKVVDVDKVEFVSMEEL